MSRTHVEPIIDPDRIALARRLLADKRGAGSMVEWDDAVSAISAAFRHGYSMHFADQGGASACRICGCSFFAPCRTEDGPCGWATDDLCTACEPFVEGANP